ncbi:MAG: segregation/condensation protein A [Candidatus Diapherotrites archaeon]
MRVGKKTAQVRGKGGAEARVGGKSGTAAAGFAAAEAAEGADDGFEDAAGAEGEGAKGGRLGGAGGLGRAQGRDMGAGEGASAVLPQGEVNLIDLIEQPEWKSILIDLVKSERMDVWDIDIALLADKYLKKINSMGGNDLRVPANAILCSAILLKFKSRILRLSDIDEELAEKAAAADAERRMQAIDGMLPELRSMHRGKEGRVSLDVLVESIEKLLERSGKGRKPLEAAERPEFLIPVLRENIEAKMDGVYKLVKKGADSKGIVLFSQLVKGMKKPMDIVMVFLPLLFLANKGKIDVWQDEFFGEIMIQMTNE